MSVVAWPGWPDTQATGFAPGKGKSSFTTGNKKIRGIWVTGSLIQDKSEAYILVEDTVSDTIIKYKILPESVKILGREK